MDCQHRDRHRRLPRCARYTQVDSEQENEGVHDEDCNSLVPDFASTPHMIQGQSLCDAFVDVVTDHVTEEPTVDTQVPGHVMTYRAKDPMETWLLRPSPRELFTRGPQTGPHMHLSISPYAGEHRRFISCMSALREAAHDICLSRQQEAVQSAGVTQLSGTTSATGASAEEATTKRPPYETDGYLALRWPQGTPK